MLRGSEANEAIPGVSSAFNRRPLVTAGGRIVCAVKCFRRAFHPLAFQKSAPSLENWVCLLRHGTKCTSGFIDPVNRRVTDKLDPTLAQERALYDAFQNDRLLNAEAEALKVAVASWRREMKPPPFESLNARRWTKSDSVSWVGNWPGPQGQKTPSRAA